MKSADKVLEMPGANSLPTLYDDWQARRDLLLQTPDRIDALRQIQLRVLEFLLRRYRDAPQAKR
ncbi:MAG: hypothetical protein KDA41_09490, partial [Planctomycetales bacterium]|nr:hypothetical protein [Planctomycetales bacterium]